MYKTNLTNFGYDVYEGDDPREAKRAAIEAGFECTIYERDVPIMHWSPVGGFRTL